MDINEPPSGWNMPPGCFDVPEEPDTCGNCEFWMETHSYKVQTQRGSYWRTEGICLRKMERELGLECHPADAIEWACENESEPDYACDDWSEA